MITTFCSKKNCVKIADKEMTLKGNDQLNENTSTKSSISTPRFGFEFLTFYLIFACYLSHVYASPQTFVRLWKDIHFFLFQ